MKNRSLEPELLDLERPTPDRLERFYRFLMFVNRFLGGTRAVRKSLENFSVDWRKDRSIWILDVATGAADIPRALVDWARKKGYHLHIAALDREADTLSFARRRLQNYPEIFLVRAAAESLPFRRQCVDYVISNLFFHHLDDQRAFASLCHFDHLAKRGIIINDLLRRRRLYGWTRFFSLFCEPSLRYDNLLSVRKAFTLPEVVSLVRQSGLGYLKIRTGFGHRFILSGERASAISRAPFSR